mgnify:CR=1 FL=1
MARHRYIIGIAVLFGWLVIQPAGAATILTHWSFDSDFAATTGVQQNDATANNGDPEIVSGGSAIGAGHLSLDGNDDLAVSPANDYELGNGQFSVSLWFRDAGSDSSDRIIATGGTTNSQAGWAMFLDTDGGQMAGDVGDGSGRTIQKADANGTVDPFDSDWHHLAFTMDATVGSGSEVNIQVFIDGVLETSEELATLDGGAQPPITNALSDLIIGSNGSTNRGMSGDLDDLAVLNGVLSPTEVDAIYNDGNGRSIPSVVPEPSAYAFLGISIVALILGRNLPERSRQL